MVDVPPKEHNSTRVIQLVHGIEIRHDFVVDRVDDGEVLDRVCDLIQMFVHGHARGVGVASEAQDDKARFFAELARSQRL
jgi:hypothetical protein